MQRRERGRVVPVQEVTVVPFETLQRRERGVEPRHEHVGGQVPEVVRRERGEERHADVRRRRAPREPRPLLAFLEVVGRQPSVCRRDERLEVAPGLAGRPAEHGPVVGRERSLARANCPAQPVGDAWGGRPEQQEWQSDQEDAGPNRQHEDGDHGSDDRAGRHVRGDVSDGLRAGEARGPLCRTGRRLPFEQAAPGHEHADQRERDGVDGFPCVIREEGQAQRRSGQRRGRVITKVAPEDGQCLGTCGPGEQAGQQRQQLRCEHEQHRHRPDRRTPRQRQPTSGQQRQQARRNEAAPQIVEDLPAAEQRQPVAHEAARRRDDREQPEQELPVAPDPAMLAPCVGQHA